jgi:hypothetical protein
MMTVTDYLDETHQASIVAVERIRRYTQQLRLEASKWEPRPMPAGFGVSWK